MEKIPRGSGGAGYFDESSLVVLSDVSGNDLKSAMNVALIIGAVRTLAE